MKLDPRILAVLAAGLVLPALAVAPQLQARVLGDTYVVRVAPFDPIDPFRGAYVDLTYPDLLAPAPEWDESTPEGDLGAMDDEESGDVFIALAEKDGVWVATSHSRQRPDEGPYLACTDRDYRIRCGIESLFLPQDEAREMEAAVAKGDMVATLKIDGRGHAALVSVDPA